MNEPLQDFAQSQYERPNQKWICGHEDFAAGCPLGPNGSGVCVTSALCEPIFQRDQWKCNRSKLQGGKCEPGPADDGSCGRRVQPCRPRRSLRAQRGRFVFACFAATVALLMIMLSSASRKEFLAPGPLTDSHGLILKDKRSDRCASCHHAGNHGLGGWLLATTFGPSSKAVPQWQKCLECHQDLIDADHALASHTMRPAQLDVITQQTAERLTSERGLKLELRATGSHTERACAACHREHHGPLHDLTAVADQHCNLCHQHQFASLAHGHPEFKQWPYRRRSRIIFDHVSHGKRHFRESKQQFQCSNCHALDANNEPQLIGGYEQNCASCHEEDLRRSMNDPLALVRLPTIDRGLFQQQGLSIGEWPREWSGDFDGAIPPLMFLMLWADPSARASLEQFEPGFDFFDVATDNYDELEAAGDLVWAIKRWLYELQTYGAAAIEQRAKRLCQLSGHAWTNEQFAGLTFGFDDRVIRKVTQQLPRLATEIKARYPNSSVQQAGGGGQYPLATWSCADDASEVQVRVSGHQNPLMRAWLDLAGQLGASGLPNTAALTKANGVGQCTMCHSLEYANRQMSSLLVNWKARPDAASIVGGPDRPFTKFQHRPHLLQPNLADCTSCHRLDMGAAYADGYTALEPSVGCSGFESIAKAECAGCHVADGAGDACLKCHNYHVGSRRGALAHVIERRLEVTGRRPSGDSLQ